MIAKCTYCGGALKFDADIQMLVCEHCSGMFPVEKTEEEKGLSENPQDTVTGTDFKDDTVAEEMECSVYKCTSCGAQLILNDVEVATYCAYCGQPFQSYGNQTRKYCSHECYIHDRFWRAEEGREPYVSPRLRQEDSA